MFLTSCFASCHQLLAVAKANRCPYSLARPNSDCLAENSISLKVACLVEIFVMSRANCTWSNYIASYYRFTLIKTCYYIHIIDIIRDIERREYIILLMPKSWSVPCAIFFLTFYVFYWNFSTFRNCDYRLRTVCLYCLHW